MKILHLYKKHIIAVILGFVLFNSTSAVSITSINPLTEVQDMESQETQVKTIDNLNNPTYENDMTKINEHSFEGINSDAYTEIVEIGDQKIEATIVENDGDINVRLHGNGKSISVNSEELKNQLGYSDEIRINLVVDTSPGSIIEDLDLNGENITLINSPNSIIQNNVIQDVLETTSTFRAYGIKIDNSPNTIIYNNTIRNIKQELTTGSAYAYGIWILNSNNVTVDSNELENINATTSSGQASAYGIFVMKSVAIDQVTINNNNITDLIALGSTQSNIKSIFFSSGQIFNTEITGNLWINSQIRTLSTIYGIQLYTATSQIKNITIISNSFNINAIASDVYLIYLYSEDILNVTISDNVRLDNAVSTGNSYGIFIEVPEFITNTVKNVTISGNNIAGNIASSTTSDTFTYGIRLVGGIVDKATIFDNTITDNSATSSFRNARSFSFSFKGITITNISLFNNIVGDNNANGTIICETYSAAFEGSLMSNIEFFNNTVLNSYTTGSCDVVTSLLLFYGTSNNITIYNNYWGDVHALSLSGEVFAFGFHFFGGTYSNVGIFNNTISKSQAIGPSRSDTFNVFFDNDSNNITIDNNKWEDIYSYSSSGNAYSWGFYFNGGASSNIIISNNIIANSSAVGIANSGTYLVYSEGNTNNIMIRNNIWLDSSVIVTGSSTNVNAYGFYLTAGSFININILDNVVGNNSANSSTGSANSYEIYIFRSSVANITMEDGFGMNITWADPSLFDSIQYADYYISRNGVLESQGTWDSAIGIILATKDLPVGTYNYTIVINGTSSKVESIFIRVLDTIAPGLLDSQDALSELGDIGNEIWWTFTDFNPDTYTILHDGSEIDSGSWFSNTKIKWNIDGLSLGTHNFTIILVDTTGNSATATLFVIVSDTTDPSITGPDDFGFEQGTTNNKIAWNATDYNPDAFILYQNGSQINTGPWTSGTIISIDLDGLLSETYNFTIVFTDIFGNSASDTVMVIVVDTTKPVTTSPADISYVEGTTGNIIVWEVTDVNNGTFTVYLDDVQISDSTVWISGDQVQLNVDGLEVGIYNLTIVFTDDFENSKADTVLITVTVPTTTTTSTTTTPSDTTGSEDPSDGGVDPLLLAGIIVGSLAALAGGGFVIFRRVRARRSEQSNQS